MNLEDLINQQIMLNFTKIIYDLIDIYYNRNLEISKKEILYEVPGIREFKKSEINTMYDNAVNLINQKYGINILCKKVKSN